VTDRKGPAIIVNPDKTEQATGVMRGRDVRFLLQNRNVDPQVIHVIAKLAEINHANTLAIAEIATMFNQMIDTMHGFSQVAENMRDKIAQFERGAEAEAEHGDPENTSH
jgi:hypothetical protein